MRSLLSASIKALIVCAAFTIHSALGQTLSLVHKADNSVWLQASAPAADPQVLQVSENLHLWIDVTNDLTTPYSFPLDGTYGNARFYRVIPTPPEPAPIRVLLLGDSMVADCCGWGRGMPAYFNANAAVINYAQSWTTTKVFLQSAEYDKMLLIKPNYVLMEYAYSDGGADPDRGSPPLEFAENLRTIIRTIRGFDGIPILLTLHANRAWDADGHLIPSDHIYNPIIKQVAAEMNTPMIDLYKLTFDLFTKLGQEGCGFFSYDPLHLEDGMHVSPLGALWVSQLIARELPDAVGPYLTGILDPPPQP